jgi:hypothetical protein
MPDLTLPERKLAGLQLIPAADDQPLERVALQDRPHAGQPDFGQMGETAFVISAASLAQPDVRWLWKDHLPRGKVTLFVGPDGAGKSLIALDLASRITSGRHWPGQKPEEDPPLGEVVVVCQPHEVDVLGIRLRNLGADMDLVHLFQGINRKDHHCSEELRSCQLPQDLDPLESAMKPLKNLDLLLVDPLSDFCPDKRREAETLRQLEGLAARHNVAVVVVVRSAVRRDRLGDVVPPADRTYAFTRCVWSVAPDEDLEGRGEFLPTRLNCAGRPEGYGFRIDDDGKICWEPLGRTKRLSEVEFAMKWLEMSLGDGRIPMTSMRDCAAEFGIKYGTLRRAADRLGVISRKTGRGPFGEWIWSLPEKQAQSPAAASGAARAPEAPDAAHALEAGTLPAPAPTFPPGTPEELKNLSREELARHGYFPSINGSNGYARAVACRASDPPPVRTPPVRTQPDISQPVITRLGEASPARRPPLEPARKPEPDGSAAPKLKPDPEASPARHEIVAHLKEPGMARG